MKKEKNCTFKFCHLSQLFNPNTMKGIDFVLTKITNVYVVSESNLLNEIKIKIMEIVLFRIKVLFLAREVNYLKILMVIR